MSTVPTTTSAAALPEQQHQLAIDFDAPPQLIGVDYGGPDQAAVTHLPSGKFNGSDYVPERDDLRLRGQQMRIWELMRDHRWRTLAEIAAHTGDPEASISAQLRHLRKPRFGGLTIEKEHRGGGLYQYRIAPTEVTA